MFFLKNHQIKFKKKSIKKHKKISDMTDDNKNAINSN